MTKRVLLCIMDGWGISKNHQPTSILDPANTEK